MKSKIQLDSLDSIEKFSCLSVDTDERKKTNSISLKHYVGKEYVTEESWIWINIYLKDCLWCW